MLSKKISLDVISNNILFSFSKSLSEAYCAMPTNDSMGNRSSASTVSKYNPLKTLSRNTTGVMIIYKLKDTQVCIHVRGF